MEESVMGDIIKMQNWKINGYRLVFILKSRDDRWMRNSKHKSLNFSPYSSNL